MTTEAQKWAYLEAAPAKDATHAIIRRLAQHLLAAAHCSNPKTTAELRMRFAQLALTVARDWVRYETDSDRLGHEDIAGFTRAPKADDPIDALWRGVDDCDAKARLFVALCIAGGLQASMVPHWHGEQLVHVSACFTTDGVGWLPVETTLTRARIGDTAATIPKETGSHTWQTT